MITYEYNMYKSKNMKFINSMLKECCFVWNRALAIQRKYYKIYGKYASYNKISNHFTKRYKKCFASFANTTRNTNASRLRI